MLLTQPCLHEKYCAAQQIRMVKQYEQHHTPSAAVIRGTRRRAQPRREGVAQAGPNSKRSTRPQCLSANALIILEQISSLKQKQGSGGVLLPDQEVKVARESAVLQSLHDLQLKHPDAAASFASLMSAHKSDSPKAGAGPLRGSFADDVLESPVDSDMAGACAQQVQRSHKNVKHAPSPSRFYSA